VRCSPKNGGVGTKFSEHRQEERKTVCSYRHAKPVFKIESEISLIDMRRCYVEPMD
jgi:hypothetical protein